MKVRVLGCSGGVGPGRRTTTFMVDDRVLLDAGTGVCDLSTREMAEITHIFLTHAHLDHVVGAAFIGDNIFDENGPTINIHATADSIAVLKDHLFNWKLWPDFSTLPNEEEPTIRFLEVAEGETVTTEQLNITAVPVGHTVPCVGYVVERAGRVFAFSGDTATNDTLWDALNALPVLHKLIVEISFPSNQHELAAVSKHYTAATLGEDLKKLKHRPKILITHNKPGCEDAIRAEAPSYLSDWDVTFLTRGDVIDV